MKKQDKPGLSRRRFLEGTAAGAVAVGCGDGKSSSGPSTTPDAVVATDDGPPPVEDVAAPDAGPEPSGKPGVVAVSRDDLDEAVALAAQLAGGLDALKPGDTVFLKPNAVHSFAVVPGIATSNDFLAAVIKLVKTREPGKIIVGDRSARMFDSETVFNQTGMKEAALAAGADEVYAAPAPKDAPEDWVMMQPTGWEETWSDAGGVLVMKKLIDADHIINLPVLKNHRWAAFSLAMKNFIGGIGDESRDPMHYKEGDPDELSRDIAVLNGAFDVTLTIIDGRAALVNGGPEGVLEDAVFTQPGVILASTDRVALDALGAAILQHERASAEVSAPDPVHELLKSAKAWELPQIVHGLDLGLGLGGRDAVEMTLDGLDEDTAAAIEALYNA